MRNILLIALVVLSVSCASTSRMPADERITLTEENIHLVNGRYDNNSNDNIYQYQTRLWSHLKPFPEDDTYNQNAHKKIPNSFIGVQIIDSEKIRFDIYDGPTLKQSKELKYRHVDGIILIEKRSNRRWKGFPLIFFTQHSEMLNLSVDANSNLVLYYNGNVSGGILIFIFGTKVGGLHTFERK